MESTDDTNQDLEKAKRIIVHIKTQLDSHQVNLSSMTREDINYLRGRLDLLEYLLTPQSGAKIEPLVPPVLTPCSVCPRDKPMPPTAYYFCGEWYCAEHYPNGVTWPIGMHGDDLKAYKERK